MSSLALRVDRISDETATIRRIVLVGADGQPLPGYAAGAHITIDVPGIGVRKYSIVSVSAAAGATAAPRTYSLGIRLDAGGGGGSRYMHTLQPGDRVSATGPANDFPVKPNAAPALLVGGGIGITPLISMAAELKSAGRPFRLIYAVRNRAEAAFFDEIKALAGDGLELHMDNSAGRVLDVEARLTALTQGEPVYMCGPKPMLKSGIAAGRKLGWAPGRLMFELFYSAAPAQPAAKPVAAPVDDGSFEVCLKSSGKIYKVPRDKSILDVLIESGADPVHDCKKGECGVCQTGVISGTPDHRDSILSDSERAAGKVMQICISRSKSARLVLDL